MTINEFIESNFKIIYNPHNNVESHTLEAIGGRDEMQDSTCSLASIPIPGLEGFSFYGVFDGHGAAFLSKYLANEMLNSIILADESFFNELANKSIKLNNNQIAIERMKEAMRKAFLNIDFKMRDLPELKPLMEKLANNEMEYENTVSAGSTAVICLITPEYFFIANCGDSRAILVSDDEVSLATKDHKPTDALEKDRIDKAGGIVYLHPQIKKFYIKSNRSEMSFTVSRALGDYAFKMNKRKGPNEQIISPEPDVYVRERSEKDEYLVLASDGIWEYFSNEQLKKKIQDDRHQMLNQINEAIRSGTTSIAGKRRTGLNNMSIILIRFPGELNKRKSIKKDSLESSSLKMLENGIALYKQKKYQEAGRCIYDAINSEHLKLSVHPRARYWYGKCSYKLAKLNNTGNSLRYLKNALECFESAIQQSNRDVDEPPFYYMKGKTLFYLRKFQESLKCFDKLLEINKKDASYNFMKGKVLFEIESERIVIDRAEKELKIVDAIFFFRRAIKYEPNVSKYHSAEGEAFFEIKKYKLALLSFEEAIKIDRNNSRYHFMKARALFLNDQLNAAIKSFNNAIFFNPEIANYHFGKGRALFRKKRIDAALECFKDAISLNDNDSDFHYYKGKALLEIHKLEDSIKCFNDAISLNGRIALYHYFKGRALFDSERFDDSIECFDKAISLNDRVNQENYKKVRKTAVEKLKKR